MISRTGSTYRLRFFCGICRFLRRRRFLFSGRTDSFTLIEVMVTLAVLSMGLLALYQSFFISFDSVNLAANRLHAQVWIDAKIWEEREKIMQYHALAIGEEGGSFDFNGRTFSWTKSIKPLDVGLYEATVSLLWREAGKIRTQAYSTYLLF